MLIYLINCSYLFIFILEMKKSELYQQDYWQDCRDIHGHFKTQMDKSTQDLIKIKV